MNNAKNKKYRPYNIFQKPMLAISHYTNICNSTMLVKFNKVIDEKYFYKFVKVLVKNFPDLKCYYTNDGIVPMQLPDEEFIQDKIKITNNLDDNKIVFTQQNSKLNIEDGKTLSVTLNQKQNSSSIIFSISHVIADGQTMLLISYLTILIVQQKKLKLLKFLILLKLHNSRWIKRKVPQMLPCFVSGHKMNHVPNEQKKQCVLSVGLDISLKSNITNLGLSMCAASLLAMKNSYPNENKIELRRQVGLRNRMPGLKSLTLGEYHIPSPLTCDVHTMDFEELKLYIANSSNLDKQIKDGCEGFSKLSNNLTEVYEKLFSRLNEYCIVNVSSFGQVSSSLFDNVYVTGSVLLHSGEKPFFNIQCAIADNILKIILSYNPYKITYTQAALFLINILRILNIDIDETHIYKVFNDSYYE